MLYLQHFEFPTVQREEDFRWSIRQTCYDTIYPFFTLSKHGLRMLDFEPVTILYGGNGCGKTTALNIMGEALKAQRDALYNRSNFFGDYVGMCEFDAVQDSCEICRIITSDDVFDYMLNLRTMNEQIDQKRTDMFDEYYNLRTRKFQMKSIDDYEELRKVSLARKETKSQYVRKSLNDNVREYSNGESAYIYFTNNIKENGLYFLDEPENSMSPERQQELLSFLEDCVRFYHCQFVIATHSPFLLSMKGAKIYDLDEDPVDIKKWTELKNVRSYYEFFQKHDKEFDH